MEYLDIGINQYLIMASHNTKVKKFNVVWFIIFLLGLCNIVMGVLTLSLVVRVLHGPKNDQSLCNTIMNVLSLRIVLMEYVLFYLKAIA
jgi:hypothetical protein